MADELELTPEQEQENIRAELEALEKELKGEAPAVLTEPEAPAEPVEEPKEEEPFDVKQAAKDVFARQSIEEKIAWAKEHGLDVVDPKKVADDENKVATGAAKMTAQAMLKALDSRVSPEELAQIEGYDDLDELEQLRIKSDIASEKRAQEIYEKATARQREQDAAQQLQQELDATAQQWAQELNTPEAAQAGREYLGQFGPEEIELYKRQAQAGGGAFVKMVQDGFKQVVTDFQKKKDETVEQPLPKSEDAGGATKTDEVQLPPEAQKMVAQMEASGSFTPEQVAETKRQLSQELARA